MMREKILRNLAQEMIFHQVLLNDYFFYSGFNKYPFNKVIGNIFRGNEEKTILILKCFLKGTVWLLNEHKLCVQELQKLKTMIDDLHRFNCKLQIFKKS